MPKYTIMWCPLCKNVWDKRVRNRETKSCPRCHRRFDYPGIERGLEQAELEFNSYPSLKTWLSRALKISEQSESLKEVVRKTPKT